MSFRLRFTGEIHRTGLQTYHDEFLQIAENHPDLRCSILVGRIVEQDEQEFQKTRETFAERFCTVYSNGVVGVAPGDAVLKCQGAPGFLEILGSYPGKSGQTDIAVVACGNENGWWDYLFPVCENAWWLMPYLIDEGIYGHLDGAGSWFMRLIDTNYWLPVCQSPIVWGPLPSDPANDIGVYHLTLHPARASALLCLQGIEQIQEAADTADTKADTADTKADTPKKPGRKLRRMNAPAVACAKEYRTRARTPDKLTLEQVVTNYVERHGGSAESILRVLSDNPDQWKTDTKPT